MINGTVSVLVKPLVLISQVISSGNNSSEIPVNNKHSPMLSNGKSNNSLAESMLSTENGMNLENECASKNSNSPNEYFEAFNECQSSLVENRKE